PLADLEDLRVPEVAGDGELLDEPVPAVDLHGLPGTLHRRLRGEQLRHRGHRLERAAPLAQPRRLVDLIPGCGDLRGHVRQLELDRLVGADRLPEGGPLAGIAETLVEAPLRQADGQGRNGYPAAVEDPQEVAV